MAATAIANKRKREPSDMPAARSAPSLAANHHFDSSYLHADDGGIDNTDVDFAAVLAQHQHDPTDPVHAPSRDPSQPQNHAQSGQNGGQSENDTAAAAIAQYHTMTVPQSTEQSFMAQSQTGKGDDHQGSSSIDPGNSGAHQQRTSSMTDFDVTATSPEQESANGDTSPNTARLGRMPDQLTPKPPVGSDEWHKIRRDNHKEVERRRRETINEGINELAKIVPGCEKNKGSILARAVQFITQLKENETQNIEKWTLEKLLTEQAIAELGASGDKLKVECQRAWAECEQWKKAAQRAGVTSIDDCKADAEAEDAD